MQHINTRRRAFLHVDTRLTCGMMQRWKLPGRHTVCRYYAHDASCRTSACSMMRHVASRTPQKSNQFWFLCHATHINADLCVVCECSQHFTCVWLERAVCEWSVTHTYLLVSMLHHYCHCCSELNMMWQGAATFQKLRCPSSPPPSLAFFLSLPSFPFPRGLFTVSHTRQYNVIILTLC